MPEPQPSGPSPPTTNVSGTTVFAHITGEVFVTVAGPEARGHNRVVVTAGTQHDQRDELVPS
ncbi:hypothetical protein GCM10010377_04310 [Streptomyces viridiviolaceus]|uniref:Uncharacterized protein n=1 Tax=Streptomyces viridiviolaceus TaxID=68282 RepID=A0ABW2DZW1_9ACTN|nr:hypothetical protein [Streptomyces viridiviolaceus]GHB17524.1 hypothetical protein GCM10010377_04310 [Streptomyces viridiviolaceus]